MTRFGGKKQNYLNSAMGKAKLYLKSSAMGKALLLCRSLGFI